MDRVLDGVALLKTGEQQAIMEIMSLKERGLRVSCKKGPFMKSTVRIKKVEASYSQIIMKSSKHGFVNKVGEVDIHTSSG